MAKAFTPASGSLAAASVGVSVNWWHDRGGVKARGKPRASGRSSPRQGLIRAWQAQAYDSFDLLPALERQQWGEIARWRRHASLSGSWSLDARLEWARRAQRFLELGLPLSSLKPGADWRPALQGVSVSRLSPDGGVRVSWSVAAGPGASGWVTVALGPPSQPGGAGLRSYPLVQVGTVPALAGSLVFNVAPGEVRCVGWRVVSVRGWSPKGYRVARLPAWSGP